MKSALKLFSLFLVIFTLLGCGLRGPLYYPADQSNAIIESNDTNKNDTNKLA